MDPKILYYDVMRTMASLEGWAGVKSDDRALVLLMAIAGQESAWAARKQVGGPARSYWQFEKGGGVAGVLSHAASKARIAAVCAQIDIPCDTATVYEAMAWNDTLAACMARLLLLTDPRPLPALGDQEAAWRYYLDNWRPGMPHPQTWPARYAKAMGVVGVDPKVPMKGAA